MKKYILLILFIVASRQLQAQGGGKSVVVHLKNGNAFTGELSAVGEDSLTIVTGTSSNGRELRRTFRIVNVERVSTFVRSPETTPLLTKAIAGGIGIVGGVWGGIVLTAGRGVLVGVLGTLFSAAIGGEFCLWIVRQLNTEEKNLDPNIEQDFVVLETWALLHQ